MSQKCPKMSKTLYLLIKKEVPKHINSVEKFLGNSLKIRLLSAINHQVCVTMFKILAVRNYDNILKLIGPVLQFIAFNEIFSKLP